MFSVDLSSKRAPFHMFYPNGQNLIQRQVSRVVGLLEAGLRSRHDNVIFLNVPYSLPYCEAAVNVMLIIPKALICGSPR